MAFKCFNDLVDKCKDNPETKTVAVAGAGDINVISAIVEAEKINLVKPILIGKREEIEEALKTLNEDCAQYPIINAETPEECGESAVELIKNKQAEFIMKGMVETRDVLRPLVHKENGLHTGRSMSVFSYNEVPQLNKLLSISDGGMIPYPTLEQKKDIILNCVEALHKLGVSKPSIAVLAGMEMVDPKMVETTDAAALVEMNRSGEIPGCEVVGPISFDLAMSKDVAKTKKYDCPYCGDFDCMIVPNMAAGNLMHKAMIICGGTKMAGVVLGAKVPVVLNSRSATTEEKFVSLALASLITEEE